MEETVFFANYPIYEFEHKRPKNFGGMPVMPIARQNFCHIGQETSDLSGLGSDSHRAIVTHPYRAGVAIPIG